MAEIELKKRYPGTPEETVSEIFSRGYLAGWENALKRINKAEAIPIEWVKRYAGKKSANDEMDCYWHFWEEDVLKMIDDWEKENEHK